MLGVYIEIVRVFPKGKALPDRFQLFFLKREGEHVFLRCPVIQDLPQGIDDQGIAAVINLVAVISDPVDAHYIRLIFDGAGL